jgi:hypothetical protein
MFHHKGDSATYLVRSPELGRAKEGHLSRESEGGNDKYTGPRQDGGGVSMMTRTHVWQEDGWNAAYQEAFDDVMMQLAQHPGPRLHWCLWKSLS